MAFDETRMNAGNSPELSDEELDKIAGGGYHCNQAAHTYDVIDDNGKIIKSFPYVAGNFDSMLKARSRAAQCSRQMGLKKGYTTAVRK